MTTDGGNLKFVSWNCKGINSPVKRTKVLNHLHHLGGQIIFLQETHFKPSLNPRIRCRWIGQSYYSSFHKKSRGVAILINKTIPFISNSVISDPNGRYLIVCGTLYGNPLVLTNVYAPNWDDSSFFRHVISNIPDMTSKCLIMGGDFNCWLSPYLDRSSTKPTTASKASKILKTFMDEFSIIDPWRFFNPTSKTYSFFSPVHHTFTRIDYFLLDSRLIADVVPDSCSYEPIVISDHSPVTVTIRFAGNTQSRPPWRFNSALLSDENFINFISEQIDIFLSINKTPDVSASTIWETLKAYIRGQVISYLSHERKIKKDKIDKLTKQIALLDTKYATNPTSDLYKKRLLIQSEFNSLTADEAIKLLHKTNSVYFEQGDKASRLLAHRLHQIASSHQIPRINTPSGVTVDPLEINTEFKKYYEALYSSETNVDTMEYNFFFLLLKYLRLMESQLKRWRNL